MRGRSRGKGPNPLTRSYESNGPDVKVRGTAQHIAEKYLQLARDAQVSSDPVAAENYFQHAEHYLRIIATAQEAMRQQFGGPRGYDEDGDEGDDDVNGGYGYGYGQGGGASSDEMDPGSQPQPAAFDPRQDRQERQERPDRQDRPERQERPNRQDGGFQGRGQRPDRRERFQQRAPDQRPHQEPRRETAEEALPPARAESPEPAERTPRPRRRVETSESEQPALPDFLTKPTPRPAPAPEPAAEAEAKPKRRRVTRKAAAETEANENGDAADKTAAE
ncbi:MAG: DUF4167 domain-containing protein [Salinarimonadaceae bacterium]|nr:MAG: DUF4167 domain-containing protein [Salinarimonadaceae bacterium]